MEVSNIYITTYLESIMVHRGHLIEDWESGSGLSRLKDMLLLTTDAVENIGDTAYESLTGLELDQEGVIRKRRKKWEPEQLERNLSNAFICFEWTEAMKSFALLLRDLMVQHQKAEKLFRNGQVDSEKYQLQKDESVNTLDEALAFIRPFFIQKMNAFGTDDKALHKIYEGYELQDNPWPVYRPQFEALGKQAEELIQIDKRINEIDRSFEQIRTLISNTPQLCQKEFQQFIAKAQKAKDYVDNNLEEKPGAVAVFLEDLENEIKLPDHLGTYNQEMNEKLAPLEGKLNLPVGILGGHILNKEIDFHRKVKQWTEAEMQPLLYEVWEHTENLEGGLKMALINIRNRASILAKGDKESIALQGDKEQSIQPLKNFLFRAKEWVTKIEKLEQEIKLRLHKDFHFVNAYDNKQEFLSSSLQSALKNLHFGESGVVLFFKNTYQKFVGFFRNVWKDVRKEETLSTSEKIVRAIESQSLTIQENQYASIFLTKGYIGESFWVGRQDLLDRFKEIVKSWEMGFRGGVLLTGNRLAGKSLFGEKISNMHFPKNTMRIVPNNLIKVHGRKIMADYELSPVLDFIFKHSEGEKTLIWIDDLELWTNHEVPLGKNIRALRDFVDNAPAHFFFVVSMSNWLKAHLQNLYQVDLLFQAEINLDHMDKEEVARAIMIRHGATHKKLIDELGSDLQPADLQDKINKVYKAAYGNIGEALNFWIANTEEIDSDNVRFEKITNYPLPDFLTPDASVLLSAIMLQKITTDYRLRRLFGTPYRSKYKSTLQRLVSLKILVRNMDGTLVVNECIANELAYMLDHKKYLVFS